MFAGATCVFAVSIAAVFAVPSTKERRSYSEGLYWGTSVEDASVAGDGYISDCSDDDSESVELAYIINKREAPADRLPRRPTRPRDRPRLRHKQGTNTAAKINPKTGEQIGESGVIANT